jgi:hypothetical protein
MLCLVLIWPCWLPVPEIAGKIFLTFFGQIRLFRPDANLPDVAGQRVAGFLPVLKKSVDNGWHPVL